MTDYKIFALKLAARAGKIIKTNFKFGMAKKNKADGSPVTQTDTKINTLVINEVKKRFPNHSVLGEEESNLQTDREFVWLCDPVDGTIPFSHGIPIATFVLSLTQNGQPILGLIYDPFGNNLYFAEPGQGTTHNNKSVKVSTNKSLESALIFCEYWQQAKFNTLPIIEALEKTDCHCPIYKSIAYGATLVARGEASGLIFPGAHAWEMAAVKIIIEEAGGQVTDFYGRNQRYDGEISGGVASNGYIHQKLIATIKQAIL
ncbi:MAG: inositol monophosphatase [Patescibacteria group bacterium]|nr:inositol monophosphatase [Patescibacteria group bacterium]